MADRIIVMHDGGVEQYDAPSNVYTRPTSPFVASFIARYNLLPGKIIYKDDASLRLPAEDVLLFALMSSEDRGHRRF